MLEDLGATAIKLGQILSTRPDVVGPVYAAELARLQDAAPPEAPGVVDGVITRELGAPPTVCFASFEGTPLAAASIGQAHAAVAHDGTAVVVKVRRPRVATQVGVDLDILERSARLLARFLRPARRYDIVGLTNEFAATLRAELDYLVEAANAERFARNFAARPEVRIPRVYRHETTTQVITLERLRGLKPDDVGALRDAGIDLPALAHRCADVMLTMIFEHGFFHADPHAGNFFVAHDGTIGLIDFGMVGRLDHSTRDALDSHAHRRRRRQHRTARDCGDAPRRDHRTRRPGPRCCATSTRSSSSGSRNHSANSRSDPCSSTSWPRCVVTGSGSPPTSRSWPRPSRCRRDSQAASIPNSA